MFPPLTSASKPAQKVAATVSGRVPESRRRQTDGEPANLWLVSVPVQRLGSGQLGARSRLSGFAAAIQCGYREPGVTVSGNETGTGNIIIPFCFGVFFFQQSGCCIELDLPLCHSCGSPVFGLKSEMVSNFGQSHSWLQPFEPKSLRNVCVQQL